jgi:predicted nucleotidyltransferase
MYGLRERDLENIYAALREWPQVEKAIIFGSRALGNYKKGSDIDLAITGDKVEENLCKRISEQLNEEYPIPFFVEVTNYNTINNKALKEHIQNHGITIYQKSTESKPNS